MRGDARIRCTAPTRALPPGSVSRRAALPRFARRTAFRSQRDRVRESEIERAGSVELDVDSGFLVQRGGEVRVEIAAAACEREELVLRVCFRLRQRAFRRQQTTLPDPGRRVRSNRCRVRRVVRARGRSSDPITPPPMIVTSRRCLGTVRIFRHDSHCHVIILAETLILKTRTCIVSH